MEKPYRPLYCPALRMKAGELAGVFELARDVAAYTLPRFIVPPRSERDKTQPELFFRDDVPDFSLALARHWRERRTFVDVTHLIDECGRGRLAAWLPQTFDRARRAGARAIPLASLNDLGREEAVAFQAALSSSDEIRLGICVSSGDMVDSVFIAQLSNALERLGLTPSDCAIVADFRDADFTTPEFVAPIIANALEALQDFGTWQHIIFQGTHYPEKNPAADGAREFWPRNEWRAWQQAVRFDPLTSAHMMFGDYAADCAKMAFGRKGFAAIRHYRYATEGAWLVERGVKLGRDKQIMREVCRKIVNSGHFAGADFSSADAYIYETANNGDGPGTPTTWRQVNTTHHITRVVADIGKLRGITLTRRESGRAGVQMSLFP